MMPTDRSCASRPNARRLVRLEELESRLCPTPGSSLITLEAAPDYTLKVNSYGRVAVLEIDPVSYSRWATGTQSGAEQRLMTQRLYARFQDQFDFILFVNNQDEPPGGNAAYSGLHVPVKNDTGGIGVPPFDASAQYDSSGRLQGTVHLIARDTLRIGPSLHELAHRWGNFLRDADGGEPSHWGFSSAGGQLGGWQYGTLRDLGGGNYDADGPTGTWFGTFANGGNSLPYSPIELYLMGLIGPNEVPPLQVAVNASWVDPANGIFHADAIRTVTIQDIMAREGPRTPDVASSPKSFRALTVVMTAAPLDQAALDQIDTYVELLGLPGDDGEPFYFNFWEATGGRGTLQMDGLLDALRPVVVNAFPDAKNVDVNGDGRDDIVGRNGGNWWVARSNGTSFVNELWGSWANVDWADVQVADVNNDGRSDLVGRNGGNWWVAKSNGTSFVNELWGAWANVPWADVRVADVNNDGRDDVVGRNGGNWWVARSNGTAFVNELWGAWANVPWVDVIA